MFKNRQPRACNIPETGFEAGLVRVQVQVRMLALAQRQQEGQVELAR